MELLKILIFLFITNIVAGIDNIQKRIWNKNEYIFHSEIYDFNSAEEICKKDGGHLASIFDGFTNVVLSDKKNFQTLNTTKDFWIGGKFSSSTKNWIWISSQNTIKFKVGDLINPTMNETTTDEMCIASSLSLFGIWKIQKCFEQKPFVCEISQKSKRDFWSRLRDKVTDKIIDSFFPIYKSCGLGWFHVTETDACFGITYQRQNSSIFKSWKDAEEHCIKLGAHLPSIHNKEEMHALQVLHISTMQPIWLGLQSDGNTKDGWKWSDNSKIDFLPWKLGFPQSMHAESCGMVDLSSITNQDCATQAWVICKQPAKPDL